MAEYRVQDRGDAAILEVRLNGKDDGWMLLRRTALGSFAGEVHYHLVIAGEMFCAAQKDMAQRDMGNFRQHHLAYLEHCEQAMKAGERAVAAGAA